jgi:hypothetical protein
MWPGCATTFVTAVRATHAFWSISHSLMWTMAVAPLILGRAFMLTDDREHPSTSGDVIPIARARSHRNESTRQAPGIRGTTGGKALVVKLPVKIGTRLPNR